MKTFTDTVDTASAEIIHLRQRRRLVEMLFTQSELQLGDPRRDVGRLELNPLTVLHYDADYDRIAQLTGQPVRWVVPRGSVP